MGTSLQVAPFNMLVNHLDPKTPILLMNADCPEQLAE